jgi:hypothetical protein
MSDISGRSSHSQSIGGDGAFIEFSYAEGFLWPTTFITTIAGRTPKVEHGRNPKQILSALMAMTNYGTVSFPRTKSLCKL